MGAETINVLLIEDNIGDVILVQEMLAESRDLKINLIVANNMAKGLKCIAAEKIHVVLLDLNLPDSEGLQTFRRIYKFALDVPIVIMSTLSDKEIVYQTLKEGAQDYLIKGTVVSEAVIRALRYAIWSYYPA